MLVKYQFALFKEAPMGIRIIVVFQHDLAHVWASDPHLGERILSHVQGIQNYPGDEIEGGYVVEVIDDYIQSLLVADRYKVYSLAYEHYSPGSGRAATCIKLLRNAAKSL